MEFKKIAEGDFQWLGKCFILSYTIKVGINPLGFHQENSLKAGLLSGSEG